MPIDYKIYNMPATKGDVAGVAIQTSLAIARIHEVLVLLKESKSIDPDLINKIQENSSELERRFNILAGWIDE